MSSKSFATGSMRSTGGSVRLGAGAGAGHELVLDALYERKRDKKSVRVLTVIIYVFCVSLAAIMLSLYYVFFWEPKDAQYAQRKVSHTVDQTSTTPMPTCLMPHTGRGGGAVDDALNSTAATPSADIANQTTSDSSSSLSSSELPLSTESFSLSENKTSGVRADNSSVT
ncbi:uncharacterized protein LOC133533865 isoform X1 [Cydia pomonella]|uniref:uncharacterized protein LOC133533865 isoform X1 n=1 Tax=Cydia pomonella TaxID=82600 RepID=UPI002ADE011D|nr:uncharacterized protein LOC133533865 isoform X1 [Cydia pomonella]